MKLAPRYIVQLEDRRALFEQICSLAGVVFNPPRTLTFKLYCGGLKSLCGYLPCLERASGRCPPGVISFETDTPETRTYF